MEWNTGEIFRGPLKIQENLLKKIIKENENTSYGKRNSFSKIDSINAFQERVPIIEYSSIEEEINLIKEGEENILTRDPIVYFATTSGTTSQSKFIPLTEKRYPDFIYENQFWFGYAIKQANEALSGKILYFTGNKEEGVTEEGIPYGPISGFVASKQKKRLKDKVATSNRVLEAKDFNEKMEIMADETLSQDIRTIAFSYPIEIILFHKYLKETKGIEKLKDIWPNLSLVGCFKKSLEDSQLENILGKGVCIQDHGIRASEGTISIGYSGKGRAGIPAIQQTFLEFLEEDSKDSNSVKLINELEENKRYNVLLTTFDGLYRYNIKDIVKVVGRKGKLPLLDFEGRSNTLDINGEHSPYYQIEVAVKKAQKDSGIQFEDYTVFPNKENLVPYYEIVLGGEETSPEKTRDFLEEFDNNMKSNVSSYKRMRNEWSRLDFPKATLIHSEKYDNLNKERIIREGQPKHIHVSENLKLKDRLLQ
ncbi:hypothetical protein HOD29_07375 [archaeon]|nr:hypothetical protein [archaeon]